MALAVGLGFAIGVVVTNGGFLPFRWLTVRLEGSTVCPPGVPHYIPGRRPHVLLVPCPVYGGACL